MKSPKTKKTARSKDDILEDGIVDKKLMQKIWKIVGKKDLGKQIKDEEKKKLKRLLSNLVDETQLIIYKETLFGLTGITKWTFDTQLWSDISWRQEIQARFAINKALETLRVLDALVDIKKESALVIRLKLVSQTARDILNEKYRVDKPEDEKELSREEKKEKVKELLSSLGSDLARLSQEVYKDDDSEGPLDDE